MGDLHDLAGGSFWVGIGPGLNKFTHGGSHTAYERWREERT